MSMFLSDRVARRKFDSPVISNELAVAGDLAPIDVVVEVGLGKAGEARNAIKFRVIIMLLIDTPINALNAARLPALDHPLDLNQSSRSDGKAEAWMKTLNDETSVR